ncbi:hypothetical protein LWI29_016601 [Acer saccharum]|uniref:F-box domain-containing protein n=1 Tax=Acer saccharum TaxID=4024 RepID=A0AA39SWX1_ACESA|nr:hypothetical protein LWI29_016601 [Acer saccharum]
MSDQEVQQLIAKKKRSSHQQVEEEEEEQQPSAKKKRIDTTMSDLPREILPIIFRKLTDHDMLVCAQVCVTWESEVRSILPQYLLLTNLSEKLGHPNNQVQNSFITLFNTHIQEIRKIHLPKLFLEGRYFSSSSFGWLLTVTHNRNPPHQVHLLNPFSGQRIELPPSTKHQSPQDLRVIMSANPSDAAANCLFLAINQNARTFGICRQGQKSWTSLDFQIAFMDVIFYKGALYGVDIHGDLCHLICGLKPDAKRLNERSSDTARTHSKYLVEMNGNLLLVERFFSKEKNLHSSSPRSTYRVTENTYQFDVFKFKFDWFKPQWIRVRSIGNYAILLGMFSSISLPAKQSRYFKSNCIYFIDDSNSDAMFGCEFPDHNTGLYDMSTKHIERLYQSSQIWKNQLRWFRPRL